MKLGNALRTNPTDIITAMVEMLQAFERRCPDTVTLKRLIATASERKKWTEAKRLFDDIRQKTLRAEKDGDELALAQYASRKSAQRRFTILLCPRLHSMRILLSGWRRWRSTLAGGWECPTPAR